MRGELNEVWIAARRRCSVVPSWRRHHGRDFQLDEFWGIQQLQFI